VHRSCLKNITSQTKITTVKDKNEMIEKWFKKEYGLVAGHVCGLVLEGCFYVIVFF
jgi:hypothetical protein